MLHTWKQILQRGEITYQHAVIKWYLLTQYNWLVKEFSARQNESLHIGFVPSINRKKINLPN